MVDDEAVEDGEEKNSDESREDNEDWFGIYTNCVKMSLCRATSMKTTVDKGRVLSKIIRASLSEGCSLSVKAFVFAKGK